MPKNCEGLRGFACPTVPNKNLSRPVTNSSRSCLAEVAVM